MCWAGPGSAAEPWRARLTPALQSLHDSQQAATVAHAVGAHLDVLGRVQVDVHHDCGSPAPLSALTAAGLRVDTHVRQGPLCVVEGWVSPAALPAVAQTAGVMQVMIPRYVRRTHPVARQTAASTGTGGIDANGLAVMRADQFLALGGTAGSGVIVGVQSSGISNINVIQNRGELPAVQVLTSEAGGTPETYDEGTALLEVVHAVAPKAQLLFCDSTTFTLYIACLQQFVQAGATVMADDIAFYQQDPMHSDGTDTQALESFLAANPNVSLFTSAGNDNGSYWEGTYNPVPASQAGVSIPGCTGITQKDQYVMQFPASSSTQQEMLVSSDYNAMPVTFSWENVPAGAGFDVYWTATTNTGTSGCLTSVGASGNSLYQSFTIAPGNYLITIATPDASLAGKFLKLWFGGDGLSTLSLTTPGSFVSPQTFAQGAITVGAVNASDGIGNTIESYSSVGPITVLYPQPATLQAPTLVGPDGIMVDGAGTYIVDFLWPDGNFYGTSASTPNAAGVAALLRSAFPQLTAAQVLQAIVTGATQLGTVVPDGTYGYGRVDAMGALATIPAPAMTALTNVAIDASTSTTSTAVPFTVSGTGNLHFSVASSNAALVPSQVVATGTAGVTVSAGCGTTTMSCSLTVTAAQYQNGTATLTVSTVDGAGRTAPQTLTVTVSNAPSNPNPPPPTGGGSGTGGGGSAGSGGGGGALGVWELLALSGFALRQVRRNRVIRH